MAIIIGEVIGINTRMPRLLTFMLICFILAGTVVNAEALTKDIKVQINAVKLLVNNQEVNADNILYNGSTYVPLRAISEMLDKSIVWDQATSSAKINDKEVKPAALTLLTPKPELRTSKTTEEVADLAENTGIVEVYDYSGEKIATGSGVIISNNGSVLTSFHVISGGYSINFKLPDERSYENLSVIAFDDFNDLVLLSIPGTKTDSQNYPSDIGGIYISEERPAIGSKVVAIGSPLGYINSVSEGIISGSREVGGLDFLQTTAAISSGSSGGVLINSYGEIVGLIRAKVINGENMNLAVPSDIVLKFLRGTGEKKENGYIRYNNAKYLGEILNGEPHGRGQIAWDDGDVYIGDWDNGERSGNGVYYFASGTIYEGGFLIGDFHGFGKVLLTDGTVTMGLFLFDKRVGIHTHYGDNGTVNLYDYSGAEPKLVK